MKSKLPSHIQQAINAGEQAHKDKLAEEEAQKRARAKELEGHYEKAKERAASWFTEVLPKIIEEYTTQGKRVFTIGSMYSGNGDPDVRARAEICLAHGMRVEKTSFDADPGEESMYSHSAGYTYHLHW